MAADGVLNLGDQIRCEEFFALLRGLDLAVEVFAEEASEVFEKRGENWCLACGSKLKGGHVGRVILRAVIGC